MKVKKNEKTFQRVTITLKHISLWVIKNVHIFPLYFGNGTFLFLQIQCCQII